MTQESFPFNDLKNLEARIIKNRKKALAKAWLSEARKQLDKKRK